MSIVTQLTNPSVSNEYIQSSNHLLSIVVNITLSNKQKKSIYIYIYISRDLMWESIRFCQVAYSMYWVKIA